MSERPVRVLVVDDERYFREAIRDVLERAGLGCALAEDGEQALELADLPRLGAVVLDLRMPGLDGLEVLRRLRAQRPLLRVIILSAHAEQESVLEALRLGASDYLAKPLHEEELVLAVQRALESFELAVRWQGLRTRLQALSTRLAELGRSAGEARGEERRDRLAEQAARSVAALLQARRTSVMLFDEPAGVLRVRAAEGSPLPAPEMDAIAVGDAVAGAVFGSGESLLIGDAREDSRFRDRVPVGRYRSTSFALAPIVSGEQRLGVLCATEPAPERPFDEDDRALLEVLARQLAPLLALDPALAEDFDEELEVDPALLAQGNGARPAGGEDEAGADGDDAELARAICEAISSEIAPERILAAALAAASKALGAAPVSLYLLDDASGELRLETQRDAAERPDRPQLPGGRGLTGTALATGHPMLVEEPGHDGRFDAEVDTSADGKVRPLLCVPLRFRRKPLGVFRAFPQQPGRISARTGEVLAAALSAAARNVLLYRHLLRSIDEVARVRREGGEAPIVLGRATRVGG